MFKKDEDSGDPGNSVTKIFVTSTEAHLSTVSSCVEATTFFARKHLSRESSRAARIGVTTSLDRKTDRRKPQEQGIQKLHSRDFQISCQVEREDERGHDSKP